MIEIKYIDSNWDERTIRLEIPSDRLRFECTGGQYMRVYDNLTDDELFLAGCIFRIREIDRD